MNVVNVIIVSNRNFDNNHILITTFINADVG